MEGARACVLSPGLCVDMPNLDQACPQNNTKKDTNFPQDYGTNVGIQPVKNITTAEVLGEVSLKAHSLSRPVMTRSSRAGSVIAPRAGCIFMKQIMNMNVCVCVSATVLSHYTAATLLPGSDPRCSRHSSGVDSEPKRKGAEVHLLATINIKLLFQTPMDNIKGLAEQNKQSAFIKMGLGGVEGRQR